MSWDWQLWCNLPRLQLGSCLPSRHNRPHPGRRHRFKTGPHSHSRYLAAGLPYACPTSYRVGRLTRICLFEPAPEYCCSTHVWYATVFPSYAVYWVQALAAALLWGTVWLWRSPCKYRCEGCAASRLQRHQSTPYLLTTEACRTCNVEWVVPCKYSADVQITRNREFVHLVKRTLD